VRTVSRISITPVKATALLSADRVRLGPNGVEENRRFHFVDPSGALVSGPQHGRLVQIRSRWDPVTEVLELAFPDGTVVRDTADVVAEPQLTTNFFRRMVPGHEVVGPFSQIVSDWYGQPLRLIRTDRAGDGADVRPLSLLSTASAEALAESSGSELPLRTARFRLLFELDGCGPFEEDTWEGRLLRLGAAGNGGATIRMGGQIPRCAVTTYDPSTGERDFPTLHAITDLRGVNAAGKLPFGVYADVEEPGVVAVGDAADLAD
jgi:uncharacterized protein YcbX